MPTSGFLFQSFLETGEDTARVKAMLQTNCPKCKGVIESPYLNEFRSVKCGQCQEVVTVENVFVATKEFTIDREDLHNRIFRYESLLREVEKERALMANDRRVSKETNQSFDQFSLTLQELLEGARSHYRLKLTRDLSLQMDFDNHKSQVKLIDISTAGASIESELSDSMPRPKAMINLQISFPGFNEPLSAMAKVVWARKLTNESAAECCRLGIKFVNLDEKTRSRIWRFITESSPGPASSFVS